MYRLVEMVFGSHLYGTATETSDRDYRGVFMPFPREIYCGRIPKCHSESTGSNHQKNGAHDIDREFYSLQYFIELASQGQTLALDMLHAPESAWVKATPIWQDLVAHRHWFYTKDLTAFVGYARRQAAKYSIKGSRLDTAKRALTLLERYADFRLADIWDHLWDNDYCQKIANAKERLWHVCGRSLPETANCGYLSDILRRFVDRYGARAQQAERNEGIDWKAISHAFRAAYQARHILQEGTFSFPLPEAPFLTAIKQGQLHFVTEVSPQLETLMDELETLQKQSALPDAVDREQVDAWLSKQVRLCLDLHWI